MIKAAIFDVGGVLKIETDSAIRRDVQRTLGIKPEAFSEPWKLLTNQLGRGAIDEAEFWKQFHLRAAARYPLPEESLLMREYKKGHQINNEVMTITHRLRKQDYKTAILSNTIASHANFNREKGVYEGFDLVVLSHEIGLNKPSPGIFYHTLNQLSIAANEAVLIDDKERNITAAQQAGMYGITFKDSSHLQEALKKLGVSL